MRGCSPGKSPLVIATFTREGDRFMTQITNQPRFQVFPESERTQGLTNLGIGPVGEGRHEG
jgi:hypothetical protein